MRGVLTKLNVADLATVETLVVENLEAVEPGLRVLHARGSSIDNPAPLADTVSGAQAEAVVSA